MRFPATIHLTVSNAKEYEAVLAALQGTSDQGVATANALIGVIDRIRITEAGGSPKDLPEAYLVVDGRRVREGTRAEMEELFLMEIAAHKAPVALQARSAGSLEYKAVRSRVVPSVTAT